MESAWVPGSGNPIKGGPAENPLYYMTAYTLRNPMVAEALSSGLLMDWCPQCNGTGILVARPCSCEESRFRGCEACSPSAPCEHCRRRCPRCKGARVREDREVCYQDFGDEASLEVAQALPGRVNWARWPGARQLR